MYIDTHAHLDFPELYPHLDSVLENARLAGVEKIITIGIDENTNHEAIEIAVGHVNVFASIGWHPHEAEKADNNLESQIKTAAENDKVVAIGEIGLDFYRDRSPRDLQRKVFARMIGIANDLDLPIIVHCRDAFTDVLEIIKAESTDRTRGVFHCFSGEIDQLKQVLDLGFFISYTGNITYKNSRLLPTVKHSPIDKVLLETDSPFLTPHPHRGKRNEPAYIPYIASKLAEIKGLSNDDISRITNYNVFRLFGIGKKPDRSIVYPIRNSLYVALTSRCTNRCDFCPRLINPIVKGHNIGMTQDQEPGVDEIVKAIGDPSIWDEVVFCGFGEPTIRLDVMLSVARWLKSNGVKKVRLNTNGQGNLIHKRDIVPEMVGLIEVVSISLNESSASKYQSIVNSRFGEDAFPALLDFTKKCVAMIPEVHMTVVAYPGIEIEAARKIAEATGAKFRIRDYNEVG